MSTGGRPEQDPRAKVRRNVEKMASMGASTEEIEAYVESQGIAPVAQRESLRLDVRQPSESTMALPHNREDRETNFAGLPDDAGPAALGLAATAGQAIPGVERLQAGARSVARRQPYGEALKDMRAVTDEIPAPIKIAAQLPAIVAGGGALGKVAGKAGAFLRSPAGAGAAIGAADQGLAAEEMSLEDRLARTAIGGAGGAAVGKTLDVLVTGGRAVAAKSFDKNLAGRKDAMSTADNAAYGGAAREMTAAGGTAPEIENALLDPVVVPFTKAVRSTQEFAQADDATVLREVYKLMSERQRALGGRLLNSEDFKAGSSLEKREIDAGKKLLLSAADKLGAGFRQAVQGHATKQGEIGALKHGKEAARQAIGKLQPASTRGQQNSPEMLRRKAPGMSLEERIAAEEGALSQLKRSIGPEANLFSGAGALTSVIRPARAGPLLRKIDTKKQRTLDDLIRTGLLGGGTFLP